MATSNVTAQAVSVSPQNGEPVVKGWKFKEFADGTWSAWIPRDRQIVPNPSDDWGVVFNNTSDLEKLRERIDIIERKLKKLGE